MSSKAKLTVVCGKICEAPPGDYFVTCSFDKNHVLLRSRMPYHIVKCEKNHPGHNKLPCPYDATEFIEKEEFNNHILHCESRRSAEDDKYEIAHLRATGKIGYIQPLPYFPSEAKDNSDDEGETIEINVDKNDYNEDLFNISGAIGRAYKGRTRATPPLAPGVRGRAELITRMMQRSLSISSVPTSSASSNIKQGVCDGQFEDD